MGLFSNKNQIDELKGRNIYKDQKNRTVYYNRVLKKGFVLKPQHFASFRKYSTRYILPLLSFLLISGVIFDKPIFNMPYPIPISIAVSAIIYLMLTFKFYKSFLPSLTTLPAYVPAKRDNIIDSARKSDLSKSIIKAILLSLISVLFVINAQQVYEKNAVEYMLYLNYLLSLASGILAIIQIYALITRSKVKKAV